MLKAFILTLSVPTLLLIFSYGYFGLFKQVARPEERLDRRRVLIVENASN